MKWMEETRIMLAKANNKACQHHEVSDETLTIANVMPVGQHKCGQRTLTVPAGQRLPARVNNRSGFYESFVVMYSLQPGWFL